MSLSLHPEDEQVGALDLERLALTQLQMLSILRDSFRYEQFRTNQRDAVLAAIQGQDIFLRLAPGAGQSLAITVRCAGYICMSYTLIYCTQLPCVCTMTGMTVIVVPWTSTLRRRVCSLLNLQLHVAAYALLLIESQADDCCMAFCRLHSDQQPELRDHTLALLSQPMGCFTSSSPLPLVLVITLEQLDVTLGPTAELQDLYQRGLITRFVVEQPELTLVCFSFLLILNLLTQNVKWAKWAKFRLAVSLTIILSSSTYHHIFVLY